jgi:glutaminyl-peptide cyclotransferase
MRPFFSSGLLLLLTRTLLAFTPPSDATLKSLPVPRDEDFDINTGLLLSPILIPRVPGTEGSRKVLRHFQDFFSTQLPAWNHTTHTSHYTTPVSSGKKIPFVNFIATRDPPWQDPGDVGRLVFVAHYDSKLTPEGFIGATDSAVPCAVIMHAVKAIDAALSRKWEALRKSGDEFEMAEERGVQVLFLDGEEAFKIWNSDDSLYGARSLAEEWERTHHPAPCTRKNLLSNIDMFVLLDLLGSAKPAIPSYFPTTHWAYVKFAEIEKRLRDSKIMKSKVDRGLWFHQMQKVAGAGWSGGLVEDDHLPFMKRGVEVLHLIPSPFPGVWHQSDDDAEHLDMDTVKDWGSLVTAWSVGYMELEGYVSRGNFKREVKTEL